MQIFDEVEKVEIKIATFLVVGEAYRVIFNLFQA